MNKIDTDIFSEILAKHGGWENEHLLCSAHVTLIRETQDTVGTQNKSN